MQALFSYNNKTGRHNINELLLKVALNTITLTLTLMQVSLYYIYIVDNKHNIQSGLLSFPFFIKVKTRLYQVVRHYVVRVPHHVLVLVILLLHTITQVIQTMVSHEIITIIVLLMQ